MKRNEPIVISDMDVQPISDDELRAIAGQGWLEAASDPGECCEEWPESEFRCSGEAT